ncbi:MAG: iron dependent repressor, metal binding and dimerization domain protein [Ethanoligenens sp.]
MPKDSHSEFRTVRGYQKLNQQAGQLTPALEDYLEMVFRCCETNKYTRVGKIAELLNVTPSSASKMVFKLTNLGYLKYEQREIILLTDSGREAGAFLLKRHNTIERFFKLIGIRDSLEETELVEHSLNRHTVKHLEVLLNFFKESPSTANNLNEFQKKALR